VGNNGGCDRERAQRANYSVFNFMYVTSDFYQEIKWCAISNVLRILSCDISVVLDTIRWYRIVQSKHN